MPTEQEYWEALQAKICAKCIDGDGHGECRIAAGRECALKTYFPQILDAVNSVYSPSIEPYEEQLRAKVCGVCVHQSAGGTCHVRESVECALDRYFPMIVQVVEETQLKKRLNM
jgi:hypothetical protein